MKNLAYVLQNGKIICRQLDLKPLPKDWVRLKVLASGICGTDLQKICSANLTSIVLGHEFVGKVIKGESERLKIGDIVVGMPLLPCYKCDFCKLGNINLCQSGDAIGRTYSGAFAQYVDIPANNCFLLPKNVSVEVAVLTDVIAVALHSLKMVGQLSNKDCLIIGDGTVGYTLAWLLKINNARVTLIGKDKKKANMFYSIVDRFLSADNNDLNNCQEKQNYDFVFETVGRRQEKTLSIAIQKVKPKGVIVVLGVFDPGYMASILVRNLFIKEARLVGSNAYTTNEFVKAIHILEKYHHFFNLLITHRLSFSKFEEGVNKLKNKTTPTIKVILTHS